MKKYCVHGNLYLPLIFEIRAQSPQAAIDYAHSIMNNQNIIKLEADIITTKNKSHLLIADEVTIKWILAE